MMFFFSGQIRVNGLKLGSVSCTRPKRQSSHMWRRITASQHLMLTKSGSTTGRSTKVFPVAPTSTSAAVRMFICRSVFDLKIIPIFHPHYQYSFRQHKPASQPGWLVMWTKMSTMVIIKGMRSKTDLTSHFSKKQLLPDLLEWFQNFQTSHKTVYHR